MIGKIKHQIVPRFPFLAFLRLEYNDHLWLITEKLLAHFTNLWFSLKRGKEKGRSECNNASDMTENTNGYYIKSQWTFDSEEVPFKIRSMYHVPVINMIAARAERAEVSLIYFNNRQYHPHPPKKCYHLTSQCRCYICLASPMYFALTWGQVTKGVLLFKETIIATLKCYQNNQKTSFVYF